MQTRNQLEWSDLASSMLELLDDAFEADYYPDLREHVLELGQQAEKNGISPGAVIAYYLWNFGIKNRIHTNSFNKDSLREVLDLHIRVHYKGEDLGARMDVIVEALLPALYNAVLEAQDKQTGEYEDMHGFDTAVYIEAVQLGEKYATERIESIVKSHGSLGKYVDDTLRFVSKQKRAEFVAYTQEKSREIAVSNRALLH